MAELESLARAEIVDGEASESDDDESYEESSNYANDVELELGEEAATGANQGDINMANDVDDDIGDADDLVDSEEEDEDDLPPQDYHAGCAKVYDGEADESDEDDDDDDEGTPPAELSSRPYVEGPMPIVIALKRTDLVTAKSARDPTPKPPAPTTTDTRSDTPPDPPPESRLTTKFDSVLHVKLAETNAALHDSITTRCQKIQQRWRKTLESTWQEFQRTHETTRKVSDSMRHLTNSLFKLDDTADVVTSAQHIPDIKID